MPNHGWDLLLSSEEETTYIPLKTFVLKMTQAKALTALFVPNLLESGTLHPKPFFFFFFFLTLVTGPRRSLSLKLSDTRVYEP